MNETLAKNIRRYRKEKGLTQLQLAEMLYIAPQTVSKWESGISEPDMEKLCQLSDLFGVSLDTLVRLSRPEDEKAYIAIDGGGTKTAFILFRENGEILDRVDLGGSNPNAHGIARAQSVLGEGIDRLISTGATVAGIYAGVAGASVGDNRLRLQGYLKERYPFVKSHVEGDIYNVIFSAGDLDRCIAVICGTGSVVYGYDGRELHRAGGWGYLFDEAGSGFDMGRDLFRYCLACEDATAEKTPLYDAVCREVAGAPIFDQLSTVYAKGKDYIASFSRIIFEFYEKNDPVALSIVRKLTDRIADLVLQVRHRADCGSVVVVSGGLSARRDILVPLLSARLGSEITLLIPDMPPIYGAAVRCMRLLGVECDLDILKKSFVSEGKR